MINKHFILFIIVTVLFSISTFPKVFGFPQIPIGYWGEARDYDGNALAGSELIVENKNHVVLTTSVIDSKGVYSLIVPYDDPETVSIEGVVSGEVVYFLIGKTIVRAINIGEQGSDIKLDISLSSPLLTSHDSSGKSKGSNSGNPTQELPNTGNKDSIVSPTVAVVSSVGSEKVSPRNDQSTGRSSEDNTEQKNEGAERTTPVNLKISDTPLKDISTKSESESSYLKWRIIGAICLVIIIVTVIMGVIKSRRV